MPAGPCPEGNSFDINIFIRLENWVTLLTGRSLDSALSGLKSEAMYDKFHDIFICSMNVHLPVKRKTFKPKPKRNSWYSPHLQLMKDRVMALLCRSRQSGQNADIEAYKAAKRTYRQALQVARKESNEEFINTADNKCKAAWTIVNRETGRDTPSHHLQPDAEDFSKYCISAVDEIRQSPSLLLSICCKAVPRRPLPSSSIGVQ
ncbi:hypothetical protein J6590_090180 [Homalodisca vitripennis]|nr:hypothetical protein J6590_090180 [Homalodisca vitripennis]